MCAAGPNGARRDHCTRLPRPEPAGADNASVAPPGAGELVRVVDLDVEIRSAMAELLRSWGWQVRAAGGKAELEPPLMALTLPLRLLVCDLRLRGDATRGLK